MHLKKLLIILISLSFILGFITSCEKDRNNDEVQPTLSMSDLANTYATKKLIINAREGGKEAHVIVTMNNKNEVTFKLVNIVEENPEVIFTTAITQKENGALAFTYTATLTNESREWDIQFNGSFVGSPESSITLVVDYKEARVLQFSDLSREYLKEELIINAATAKDKVTAIIEIDKEGVGTIILNNITIGQPEHRFSVKFEQDTKNTFSFVAEEEDNQDNKLYDTDRIMTLTGTVVNNVLTIDHSLKITSEVVDNWQLFKKKVGEPELVIDAKVPKNIMLGIMLRTAAIILKPELGKVVENVSLQFSENGKLKIGYTLTTEGLAQNQETQVPIDIDYYIKSGGLYLAIPQELLNVLELLIPANFPISIEQIKEMVTLEGTYYTLPLHKEARKAIGAKKPHTVFYLNKDVVVKLLPTVEELIPEEGLGAEIPVIGGKTKEQILKEYITPLYDAEWIKVGLGFETVD